jgi:hypothetical protein
MDKNKSSYEIFGLTPTTNAVMFVEPPGYTVVKKENITIVKNQVTSGVNFTLQELNKIQGKITDTAGNPIKEAIVVISSEENMGSTETDINGVYQIAGLTAGSYTLQAWKPCYVADKRTVTILEGQPLTLNIQLQKDTTYECPPEWQGYNPNHLPYDTGWYLEQPYKCAFGEDFPMNAEFILTGTPPGCCPCPPCPDCPSGVWTPVTYILGGWTITVVIGYGKQWGMVGYRCPILGHEDVVCVANYRCTLIGLFGEIAVEAPYAIGVKCARDLAKLSQGVTISIPIGKGVIGPGITIMWGGALYITPSLGLGAGGAYIRCTLSDLVCTGPCAPY